MYCRRKLTALVLIFVLGLLPGCGFLETPTPPPTYTPRPTYTPFPTETPIPTNTPTPTLTPTPTDTPTPTPEPFASKWDPVDVRGANLTLKVVDAYFTDKVSGLGPEFKEMSATPVEGNVFLVVEVQLENTGTRDETYTFALDNTLVNGEQKLFVSTASHKGYMFFILNEGDTWTIYEQDSDKVKWELKGMSDHIKVTVKRRRTASLYFIFSLPKSWKGDELTLDFPKVEQLIKITP